jgi:hypothetical protein
MHPVFIYSPVRIPDSSVSRPRHTMSWYEGTKIRDISIYPCSHNYDITLLNTFSLNSTSVILYNVTYSMRKSLIVYY